MQAKGLVDESMQCEDPSVHRWQQIAHLLSLTPDQMNSLVALRTSMNARYVPQRIWAPERLTASDKQASDKLCIMHILGMLGMHKPCMHGFLPCQSTAEAFFEDKSFTVSFGQDLWQTLSQRQTSQRIG